jgi:hypothetical protein
MLKNNGFYWDTAHKFWTRLVSEAELDEMKNFLTEEVYPKGKMKAEFSTIELRDRFKAS